MPIQSVHAYLAPAQVTVESTQWGEASPEDVRAVLQSVIEAVSPYLASRQFGNILIRNGSAGPVSLYEKSSKGEYIIELDVQGRHWAQLAYQFSHELCHLMSNYDLAPNNVSHQQWFEEALCEAFSLSALDRMANQWAKQPPYPQWQDFAPKFTAYKQKMLKEAHRQLPKGTSFKYWYRQHQTQLSNNPYAKQRELNELVSLSLLPLFDAIPANWVAINYLNLGDDSKDKSLQKYLSDWQTNAPLELRPVVKKVQQLFFSGGP